MTPFRHLASPLTVDPLHPARPRRRGGSMHAGLEETGDRPRIAAFYAPRARGRVALIVTGAWRRMRRVRG